MKTSNIGLIGLAVMGENLALNMESKGFAVSVYNRTAPGEEGVVDRFMSGRGKGKNFIGTHTIQEFVESIERPRKIMLMVKAGAPVDELMAQLIPYLSPGDVIIDGGNSDFHDTERRVKEMEVMKRRKSSFRCNPAMSIRRTLIPHCCKVSKDISPVH